MTYLYTFLNVYTKVHTYFNFISLTQGFGLDPLIAPDPQSFHARKSFQTGSRKAPRKGKDKEKV